MIAFLSHNQRFIMNLKGCQVLVMWSSYHLTWCKVCSYLQQMSFDVVSFFPLLQMRVVVVLSDPTQMLSLSIVHRLLLGVVLQGWRGNSLPVFSLHEVQLWRTKGCYGFFVAGCGTGCAVIEFRIKVGGVFGLEAPDNVPGSAAAFFPVINWNSRNNALTPFYIINEIPWRKMSPSVIKDFLLTGAGILSWFFWSAHEKFKQEVTWIGEKCSV